MRTSTLRDAFHERRLFRTAGLLVLSNLFMTYAWYGHLKTLRGKPLMVAVLASWGVAFFEYLLQFVFRK